MTPFYVKDDSGHKHSSPESKMCRESQQRVVSSGTTNFPPIAEYSRLTSPGVQRRASHDGRTRWEPHRPTTGAPSSRPRSNSDYSQGDVWSIGRRSICSSNGRSSMSFSSGDVSTVPSTEKLWRRRKLSPRRVISRPVTPFPAGEALHNPVGENGNGGSIPSPPQNVSTKPQPPVIHQARRRSTCISLAQKHQPIAEEQTTGKINSNKARRKVEDCLERQPQPPSQQLEESEVTKTSERRRRKSMPEMYQRQRGEARKTDTEGKKTEIMDHVTRERIMNWLDEVAHAKDEDHEALQEALSAIDEE